MKIHSHDTQHLENVLRQLDFKAVTKKHNSGLGSYHSLDSQNWSITFYHSSPEHEDQPVLVLMIISDFSRTLEIQWVGIRALLCLAVIKKILTIIIRLPHYHDFTLSDNSGEDLLAEIKDIDHTFVTPDIYLEHK